jgi:hypothetical protein
VNAVGELRNLQSDLNLLIQDKEPKYKEALRRGDVVGAQEILAEAHTEADGMVTERGERASKYVTAVDFTAPLPEHPAIDGHGPKPERGSKKRHKQTDPDVKVDGPSPDGTSETSADSGTPPHDKNTPLPVDGGPNLPGADDAPSPLRDKQTDVPRVLQDPVQMPFPSPPMGTNGGSGISGAGGLTSGLGSGLRPSSAPLGSVAGVSAGTSPASVMPQVPSGGSGPAPASASPLANAGSSFQSGLASGMGATGGMGSPITPPTQPLQPLAPQQPAVAAPGGLDPAGVPAGSGWSGPVDSAGVSSGHGGAGPGGGTAMMPPPAGIASAQPLAPYSPAGAGAAGGAGSRAPTSPTPPAGGGSAGQPAGTGGGGSAGGSPGAPPMLTGNPGSSTAMSALAGSSTEVNPDLLTAQRVLAELVRGSEESAALVLWAVAVLKSPFGSHIVVANNVGGGRYLPPTVYLPTTVRMAVSDPSLPLGWADVWMGCQKPSKILVDYFDRLRKVIAGVAVSALVTTELWPEPPHAFGGDFLGMEHKNALRMVSEAPKLDAAHQHRLSVVDLGLAQRVNSLDRGGDVSARAAATLTGVLFREATNPDSTGSSLVERADGDMLQAVSDGRANPEMWAAYDRAVDQRHDGAATWPEQHAPRDNDDSAAARAAILWYTHYYRVGRMIESIRLWKARPPRLAEVAYCGIMVGFGPAVVNTIAAMEPQRRQR